MSAETTRLTFERVDWDEYDATDYVVERRTHGFLTAFGALVAAFLYHYLLIPPTHYLGGGALREILDPRGESA
jgi:hypothetical protein